MKYIQYLKYLLRHKWFVMTACFEEGLFIQGIFHDSSKFLPDEYIPYARFFYGKTNPRNSSGYYKPFNTGNMDFEYAWNRHIHRNPHHWQYWVRQNDDGRKAVLPMPMQYVREMLCDWEGAGKAQGFFPKDGDRFSETRQWYEMNKRKMILDSQVRRYIEFRLKGE